MRKNLRFTPLLILLSLAFVACKSDGGKEPVCIAVAPSELTLEVVEMQTLSVLTGTSARGLEVSFTSSATDIATVISLLLMLPSWLIAYDAMLGMH